MVPTLFGIMVLNFIIVQAAPGGPVERILAQLQGQGVEATARFGGGEARETGQVMQAGAIHGFPMQDISVVVYDGKHHSVDSKEIAFIQAGKKAFMDAVEKARPILMEPIVSVAVTVPSDCAGGVAGDLSSMRGMISGTETLPDNRIVVSGQAPLKEIQAYHSRLKSLTGGEGSFTMDFSHYAEMSPDLLDERERRTA